MTEPQPVQVLCSCGAILTATKHTLAGKVAQNHAQTEPALSDGLDHSDYTILGAT